MFGVVPEGGGDVDVLVPVGDAVVPAPAGGDGEVVGEVGWLGSEGEQLTSDSWQFITF